MLNKRSKAFLKSAAFFAFLFTISLLIFAYIRVSREISGINAFVTNINPASAVLSNLGKVSQIMLAETVLLCAFFVSILISVVWLMNEYFQENKNSLIDELTEIYNRKGINQLLRREISRAERQHYPLSVAMLDIDHFKDYNDLNGHLMGDWLLYHLAKILKLNFREMDIVGRYGGEEFVVVMPETGNDHAVIAAERIRKLIEKTKFPRTEKITVSIGLATFNSKFNEIKMLHKADSLLYLAKHRGRNNLAYKEYE